MEGDSGEAGRERGIEVYTYLGNSLIIITNTPLEVNRPSSNCRNRSYAAFVSSSDSPLCTSMIRPKAVAKIVSMVKEQYVLIKTLIKQKFNILTFC